MISELAYLLSVLLSLAAYAAAVAVLWVSVECVYWVYCKATGKKY